MGVRIVTDSASSIAEADCLRLGIEVVPLHVISDGRHLSEAELHDPVFYDTLFRQQGLPSTSQPSPEEFAQVFGRLTAEGHEVLAVLISAGMSSTVDSARIAVEMVRAEQADARIEVVDSRSNSLEEGFAVLSAAEEAAAGAPLELCKQAAEDTVLRTRFLFTPHSLEYLKRGGRISGAAALLGVMLKRCGLKRATVQYIADEREAAAFASDVIEPVAGGPVPIVPIHPIIGVHVGPAVGVVYETVEPLR